MLSRKVIGIVVVLSLIAALQLASVGAQFGSTPTPSGNAANGKKLYANVGCWECHGFSAQGGSAGPRLGPDPISFPAFTEYLRGPKGEMPPYTAKVLSEAQLADIYAFLKSLPPSRNVK